MRIEDIKIGMEVWHDGYNYEVVDVYEKLELVQLKDAFNVEWFKCEDLKGGKYE